MVDGLLCCVSVLVAFYLRLGEWPTSGFDTLTPTLLAIGIAIPIFIKLGLYRAIMRYAGWSAMLTIVTAVALYAIPYAGLVTFLGIDAVPRTVGLIQPIVLCFLVGSSRAFVRVWLGEHYQLLRFRSTLPRALIYGAGNAGRQLARAIRSSDQMAVLGFIDDDPGLHGATLDGLPIHSFPQAQGVIRARQVEDVLLAIPSANRMRRAAIVEALRALQVHVLTLPSMVDIARGKISLNDLHELDIEDLLGRASIPPRAELMDRNVRDKVVMVTGAGGSIGQELCRQIVGSLPSVLLLFEMSEFALYAIHEELGRMPEVQSGQVTLIPLLGSVADPECVEGVLSTWFPHAIFHAAAYKHVPLVENNLIEGIRNNVFGTLTLATAARRFKVASFTLISTDKAVRPTNVMGATKRLAELILQAFAVESPDTTFAMVRFGNVLGSSGSVVPLFRAQIAAGGPVSVTDVRMTRYFMTIPEAAQLVVQAGAMAKGGDVFVLEMGRPVKIADLARKMIVLSGLTVRDAANPDGDIEIREVGLRPGEKLFEELLIGSDARPSDHPRIMMANERMVPWADLARSLDRLARIVARRDAAGARTALQDIVPEYAPNSPIADLHHRARGEVVPLVAASARHAHPDPGAVPQVVLSGTA